MKLSKDFWLAEFVPMGIYERYHDNSIWFIDPKIVAIAQFLRDRLGKAITINNYLSGGEFQYSGFRDHGCKIGAINSQHRQGRAIDFRVRDMSPEEVRQDIAGNFKLYRSIGLTTIEEGTRTWTHVDCRQTLSDQLLIVKG